MSSPGTVVAVRGLIQQKEVCQMSGAYTLPCILCRKPVERKNRVKQSTNTLCSNACKAGVHRMSLSVRECARCLSPFWATGSKQKYCTQSCGSLASATPDPVQFECVDCGTEDERPARSTRKVRCERCQAIRSKRSAKERQGKPPRTRRRVIQVVPCSICRTPVELRRQSKPSASTTCSKSCRSLAQRLSNGAKPCDHCGTSFWPATKTTKLCGVKCNGERRATELIACKCHDCGDSFQLSAMSVSQRRHLRCSQCRRHVKGAGARLRADGGLKRSLETYGASCHLCTLPIDMNLDRMHPMSVTADHIVPVSHGGSNLDHNIRPAHRRCNTKRRTRPLSECKPADFMVGDESTTREGEES